MLHVTGFNYFPFALSMVNSFIHCGFSTSSKRMTVVAGSCMHMAWYKGLNRVHNTSVKTVEKPTHFYWAFRSSSRVWKVQKISQCQLEYTSMPYIYESAVFYAQNFLWIGCCAVRLILLSPKYVGLSFCLTSNDWTTFTWVILFEIELVGHLILLSGGIRLTDEYRGSPKP